MTSGPLEINTNPRNGKPAFNTSLFAPETLGQLGNAARRFFHGPGIENFDMQISKTVRIYGIEVAGYSGGSVSMCSITRSSTARRRWTVKSTIRISVAVVSAAAPRLIQVAAKIPFLALAGRKECY